MWDVGFETGLVPTRSFLLAASPERAAQRPSWSGFGGSYRAETGRKQGRNTAGRDQRLICDGDVGGCRSVQLCHAWISRMDLGQIKGVRRVVDLARSMGRQGEMAALCLGGNRSPSTSDTRTWPTSERTEKSSEAVFVLVRARLASRSKHRHKNVCGVVLGVRLGLIYSVFPEPWQICISAQWSKVSFLTSLACVYAD